ncbi:MAG TPA: hypothetical protein VNF26_05235 [Candidatus Baltobacterales bacterium]|nr:hypothetical protein [Candidatus Baltobacterales bacterium]
MRRSLSPSEELALRAEMKDVLVARDHDRIIAASFVDDDGEILIDLSKLTPDGEAAKRHIYDGIADLWPDASAETKEEVRASGQRLRAAAKGARS